MAPRTYSPRSEEIRKASKPPRASISFDIEAEAKSAHTVRKGLLKAWFCPKCGKHNPPQQMTCGH